MAKQAQQATETSAAGILAGLLSRAELAKELRKSPRTIARWHARRVGPRVVYIGGSPYYPKDEVRDWALSGGTSRKPRGKAA